MSAPDSAPRTANESLGIPDVTTVTAGRNPLARLLPFLGPAFIASIAYMDPGNFATNLQAGADYGYLLVWVVVASNLMAMLIQTLSAKLGIATGMSLPRAIRERFPRPVTWALWVIAELVAMATDLAEFLGAAIALNLLFGMPLLQAGIITGVATFPTPLTVSRFNDGPDPDSRNCWQTAPSGPTFRRSWKGSGRLSRSAIGWSGTSRTIPGCA